MATVAFSLAGSLLGSQVASYLGLQAVGTAIATTVGSIIGAGIANELFPTNIQTERLDDLNITTSAYGLPIPLVYGQSNRVSGNVIWSSGLNETVNKKKVGSFPARTTITSYTYDVTFAIALAAGECRNVNRIWFNKKLAFDRSAYSGTTTDFTPWTVTAGIYIDRLDFKSLSFYPGNFTQTPDPVMEAALGVGNVPAYRGTCYLVFKNLQLKDYGNALPTVEVELAGQAPENVAGIIGDVCNRVGFEMDELAIDGGLTNEFVRGYQIVNAGNAINSINPLMVAFGAIPAEQGGTVRIKSRANGAVTTIPIEDMGAGSGSDGRSKEYPIKVARAPDTALPREVGVTYYDIDRDYQSGTQRSQRAIGNPSSVSVTEFPITFTAAEAKKIADRALFEPYLQRVSAQFSVSDNYEFLKPGDLVLVYVADRYRPLRISRITRGANNVIDVEGFSDDRVIFDGSGEGIEGDIPANPLRATMDTTGYLFNPPLLSGDQTASGYVATVSNGGNYYPGSVVYYSTDDATFNEAGTFPFKNKIADCTTTLGSVTTTDVIDSANTLRVTLLDSVDTLDSITESELVNGFNLAWVGKADGSNGELIQFQTATLVSAGVYDLTGLMRGRRATEHYANSHVSGEKFVLLDSWTDIDNGETDVNRLRYFKFVTNGVDPASITSSTFTGTGEGGKPRAVALVGTDRDSSNDVTITWLPRTRFIGPGLGYGPVPLVDTENYEIDITDVTYTTVYRTISTTSRTTTYTAAQATADGLTPSATRYGVIYFVNSVRGRGYGRRFIIS